MGYNVLALLRLHPEEWLWGTRWNGYITCFHPATKIKINDAGWFGGADVYYADDVLVPLGFWERQRVRCAMRIALKAAAADKIRQHIDEHATAAECRMLRLRSEA